MKSYKCLKRVWDLIDKLIEAEKKPVSSMRPFKVKDELTLRCTVSVITANMNVTPIILSPSIPFFTYGCGVELLKSDDGNHTLKHPLGFHNHQGYGDFVIKVAYSILNSDHFRE